MATRKKGSKGDRSRTITFRGSRETVARLRELAKHYDQTPSDVMRRLIVDEHARVSASPQPKGE